MKTIVHLSIAGLGKMLAEYCVTQGWADDIGNEEITLNSKGIEVLSGPPYYFDLNLESDDNIPNMELPEQEITFTWYKRNFSPGRRRSMGDDRQTPTSEEGYNWRPSIMGSNPVSEDRFWRPPPDRQNYQKYQHSKQRPKHFTKQQYQNQKDNTPIKMEVNLPPIARTNNYHSKNRYFNKKNR